MLPLFTDYPPVTHLSQSDVYLTVHNSHRAKMVSISLSDTRCVNVPLAICQTFTRGKLPVRLSVVQVHLSALEAKNVHPPPQKKKKTGISFAIARLCTLRSDVDKSLWPWDTIILRQYFAYKTIQHITLHHATLHAVGAVSWGAALQVGRPRVRFPMASLEFFIDINLPAALWLWGRLSL